MRARHVLPLYGCEEFENVRRHHATALIDLQMVETGQAHESSMRHLAGAAFNDRRLVVSASGIQQARHAHRRYDF